VTAKILVAGVGNIFLGDDGFGPEVVRRMLLAGADAWPPGVAVVDYGIRGMHLAYDLLEGYDALVLVDAMPGAGAPGDVRVVSVDADDLDDGPLDAHSMQPVAVLRSVEPLGGQLPPTYVVGCQPETVAEGMGLSAPVAAAVPEAIAAVSALLHDRLDRPQPERTRSV
jgi:hydrogenase maturation protease